MNTDNFFIDNNDIELAQNICKVITNSEIRNRAVANAIAGTIASKFFDKDKYEIDSDSGLHNIGVVLEDIDISDIYINGNYFDVRVFFNEEEICVPAAHFRNNLLPTAYMFIQINTDLSGASVIGFINPDNVKTDNPIDGYYHINEDELESFYDVEPLIVTPDDSIEVDDKDIFAYLDNTLKDRDSFYAELLKSKDGRIKLIKAVKAQSIFQFVSIVDETEAKTIDNLENSINDDLQFKDDNKINLETSGVLDILNDDNIEELSFDNVDEETTINSIKSDDVLTELDNTENTSLDNTPQEELDITEEINIEEEEEEEEETDSSSEDHFEYSTVTSPSLDTSDDILNELSTDNDDGIVSDFSSDESTNSEQIESLFNNQEQEDDSTESSPGLKVYSRSQKKSSLKPIAVIIFLIIAGTLGYFGTTKYLSAPPNEDILNNDISSESKQEANSETIKAEEAMPIETVETSAQQNNANEGIADTIPVIEQNLDASILVSNLKVEWEVPSTYTSNTSAKRYLTKLGKIIQLNLKTELLLLNKPPITNKIAVEIKYNSSSRKFETAGIAISSGEKSVDNLILQTVSKALAMNLSTNTDSFAKLQGNPVLIIHL